jgi:hypothetical protein
MQQFIENVRKNKIKTTISWAKSYRLKQLVAIREVESNIGSLLIEREVGSLSKEEETVLKVLLRKK